VHLHAQFSSANLLCVFAIYVFVVTEENTPDSDSTAS